MKQIRMFVVMAGLIGSVILCAGRSASSQVPGSTRLTGLLNDYSPSTVSGGPWEMHGQWTLTINGHSGTADFTADMTMSGYGKTTTGAVDPTQAGQGAHTHHIRLNNAAIAWNTTGCPTFSPATHQGFQLMGTVDVITGNGSNAPFETSPPSSTLQVCVSGGQGADSVQLSNITLVFGTGSPAIKHFGPQAIHGVVRSVSQ